MDIPEIDIPAAQSLLEAGEATFVDIRDLGSFQAGHVPGAAHLDDTSIGSFIESADMQAELVVYCYHGNMSLTATAYLIEQGFRRISSMAGGFEAWQQAGGASATESG